MFVLHTEESLKLRTKKIVGTGPLTPMPSVC